VREVTIKVAVKCAGDLQVHLQAGDVKDRGRNVGRAGKTGGAGVGDGPADGEVVGRSDGLGRSRRDDKWQMANGKCEDRNWQMERPPHLSPLPRWERGRK